MTFADKLRELRMNAGLSQKEFGEKVGVSQAAVAYWENGTKIPAFNSVQALCLALGVECTVFNGCEYAPIDDKRTRGRPTKKTPKIK